MLDYYIAEHGLSMTLIKGEKRTVPFTVGRRSKVPFSIATATYTINVDPEETDSCNIEEATNKVSFLIDTTSATYEKGKSYQITVTANIDASSEIVKGRVTLKVT